MPSLNDLRQFKSSFHDIGGQKADLAGKNLPFDDLPLPKSKPATAATPADDGNKPKPAESEVTSGDGGDFDFGSLIGPEAEVPSPIDVGDADEEAAVSEEFYTPKDLLSNFPEELDEIPPDFEDEAEPAVEEEPWQVEAEETDFDLGDLGDAGKPQSADGFGGSEGAAGSAESMEDFGRNEDADFDFGDLGDLDLSDDPLMSGDSIGALDESDFNLEGFDDLGISADPASEDAAGEDDFNLGDFDLSDDPLMSGDSIGTLDESDFSLDDLDDLALSDDPLMSGESIGTLDESDFSFDDLDDLGLSEEPASAESATGDLGDADGADFSFDDFGDPGLSGNPPETGESAAALGGSDFSLDDLDNLVLSDEPNLADESADASSGDDLGDTEDTDFDLGDLDLPDEPTATDGNIEDFGETGETDFDLGDPDNFGLSDDPTLADESADEASVDESFGDDFGDTEDTDFNLDDLGVSDEPPATDNIEDFGETGETDFNLGDPDNFGLSDEPPATDNMEGFGETGETDFNLGDPDNFGLSDEPPATDNMEGFGETGETDFNLGDPDNFGLSDEPPATDNMEGFGETGETDLNFGDSEGDLSFPDDSATEDGNFGLPDDGFAEEAPNSPKPAEEEESAAAGIGDFEFPNLENALGKPKAPAAAAKTVEEAPEKPAGIKGLWGKAKPSDAPKIPTSLEEIKISDADFRSLKATLAGYPLNLRIACQEIIAENDAGPEKMSALINLLVQDAPVRTTAALAGEILGKPIIVPRRFEKSSGEALEAEQATFSYLFTRSVLPVLRLITVILIMVGSIAYLGYRFVYNPIQAERIYRAGYAQIYEGNFQLARDRFDQAFAIHRIRNWFYRYAEAFRELRQFALAEQHYELLLFHFPRDRKGVLDFADLQTNYIMNYEKAESLLRRQILDFDPNDFDALLAVGDNSLAWAEIEPSKFEVARISFARLLEVHGWTSPVVERMLRFFIRTDDLGQTLYLKDWFDQSPKRTMQAATLAELGGYLMDKQLEETRGVPNEFIGQIRGVHDLLMEAIKMDPSIPESYYHISRFFRSLGLEDEERGSLEYAIRAFDNSGREESVRRLGYRINAHQRYADILVTAREFIAAEQHLVRGISLYEDGMRRMVLQPSPKLGMLFAGLGDLEYFVKSGDMEAALNFYQTAEENGWSPPEMLFRMGAANYQLENWGKAMEYFFVASSELPLNRRVLFALGNAAFKRGDFRSAQGYYNRLLSMLENQRQGLPLLLPNDRPEFLELAERLMMARNNAGVANEMLSGQSGDMEYRTRALTLYAEAQMAWDARTRDPTTMIRSGSIPLPNLNMRNSLNPQTGFEPQIFTRIDRDALETSPWENLAPQTMW